MKCNIQKYDSLQKQARTDNPSILIPVLRKSENMRKYFLLKVKLL